MVKKNYIENKPIDNSLKLNLNEHCESIFEKMNEDIKKH